MTKQETSMALERNIARDRLFYEAPACKNTSHTLWPASQILFANIRCTLTAALWLSGLPPIGRRAAGVCKVSYFRQRDQEVLITITTQPCKGQ